MADCGDHPYPGTFPTVVTREQDWGGWRVPGAEYDLDPQRIEMQARTIAASQKSLALLEKFVRYIATEADNIPDDLLEIAQEAATLISHVREDHLQDKIEEHAAAESVTDPLEADPMEEELPPRHAASG